MTRPALFAVILAVLVIATVLLPASNAIAQTSSIQVVPKLIGPATKVSVLIADSGLDANPKNVDEYRGKVVEDLVQFSTDRNEVGEASPDLKETGPNTGVFKFTIQLETDGDACKADFLGDEKFAASGGSQLSIGVCPGDILFVTYNDEHAASGQSDTASSLVEIKSWDPEFTADKDVYLAGDRVTVTINDPDGNRDPDIPDLLKDIRVFSESDTAGRSFSALETGKDTGIFNLSFSIASERQGNAILVKDNDDLTVEYVDEFPANFTARERTNTFVIPIVGRGDDGDAITPSIPVLKLPDGGIHEALVGNQMMLATTMTNNNDQQQPFAAILEVRDSDGVTVFLGWQSGTIDPNGHSEVGMLWTPEQAGNYELRTFAISNLSNPLILSMVQSSNVEII